MRDTPFVFGEALYLRKRGGWPADAKCMDLKFKTKTKTKTEAETETEAEAKHQA